MVEMVLPCARLLASASLLSQIVEKERKSSLSKRNMRRKKDKKEGNEGTGTKAKGRGEESRGKRQVCLYKRKEERMQKAANVTESRTFKL